MSQDINDIISAAGAKEKEERERGEGDSSLQKLNAQGVLLVTTTSAKLHKRQY